MKKKLKITYFGRFKNNKYAEIHENKISEALKKLGCIVHEFDVTEQDFEKILKSADKSDMFLFHDGGVSTEDNTTFYIGLAGLQGILSQIKCKKVFWLFDRVMGLGDVWADTVLKMVDCGFFNDDTWVRRHKYENAHGLHMGVSEIPTGTKRDDMVCDVAFVGRVYGKREEFVRDMKLNFGKNFKVFSDVWGNDFADLCQSARVIVQPKWLMNDFLWTDSIYRTLSAGGFLIFPRLQGLKEEGFNDGTTYVGYVQFPELVAEIDFFLKPENEETRQTLIKQGRDLVLKNFTWEQRLEKLLKTVNSKQ